MIKDEKPTEQPERPRPMRRARGFQEFVDGMTLSVVAILIVVIFMVYLTNITVNTAASFRDMCFQMLVMYVCTVSVHILLRSYGRRKGRATKDWEQARENIIRHNREILERGLSRLTFPYCRQWEREELESVQGRILSYGGISLQDFKEKYMLYRKKELREKFPNLTEIQIGYIIEAQRVRKLHYRESYLRVDAHGGRRTSPSGGISARGIVGLQTAKLLVTTAITSMFSASLALEIVAEPTFATVVTCLVKIVILLFFAAFGIVGGYNHSYVRETEEMNAKADEQTRFLKWCEESDKK